MDLAIQILDGTPLREGSMPMTVTEATFAPRETGSASESGASKRRAPGGGGPLSKKQRAVALKQEQQLLGWDGFDDDFPKSEVTVIMKHLFNMRNNS